jgi:ribonuclease P protein component
MGAALERLKQRREFLAVARSGRKWVAPGLILQIRTHGDAAAKSGGGRRIGFTVSRKVGGAVVRNRARRRLRAAAAVVMTEHAAPGHDYVVIGRGTTTGRPFAALSGDLEDALRALGAWRDGEEMQEPNTT